MVYINFDTNKADRLIQSIDFAIRDLLDEENDPFSLSVYLYVFTNHKTTSINTDRLAIWGIDWIKKIFIEKDFKVRNDEAVASASLAIVSLKENPHFKDIREEVTKNFKEILSTELKQNKIPFLHPEYGVMLLLTAHMLQIVDKNLNDSSKITCEKFFSLVKGKRLFGLPFGIKLSQKIEYENFPESLKEDIKNIALEQNTNYEDQIYLLQSLWNLNNELSINSDLMDLTEKTLNKSPAWMYLMNGLEDISPAGDGQINISVSHLFRASLFDVLTNYQSKVNEYQESKIDARYKSRKGISVSAFGFYVLLFLICWGAILYPTIKYAEEAFKFWILNDFSAMSKLGATLYFFVVINLGIFLTILTIKLLPAVYQIFIKSNIDSDQRIKDILFPEIKKSLKIWGIFIFIEVVLGVILNIIPPSFQYIFGKSD